MCWRARALGVCGCGSGGEGTHMDAVWREWGHRKERQEVLLDLRTWRIGSICQLGFQGRGPSWTLQWGPSSEGGRPDPGMK